MLAAAALSILGCRLGGSVTHLIPDGYVGPVVVVYDDPNGVTPKYNDEGGVVYEIPSDGVLRLNTPTPEAALYDVKYFYVRADGTREELPASVPHVADEEMLQVFAVVEGATAGERNERPPARWTWWAYVVGIPAERDDWVRLREEAENRAIGLPPDPAWLWGK